MDRLELAKRGIKVCLEEPKRLIIHTTKLFDTLFYIQTLGWKIWDIQADDIITKDKKVIEGNLLFYYK